MIEKTLNKLYQNFASGGLEKQQFEGLVFRNILKNYSKFGILEKNPESASDFLSWIYPRLSNALSRYKPVPEATFDTYVNAVIRMIYREYKVTEFRRQMTEFSYWSERAHEYNDDNEEGLNCAEIGHTGACCPNILKILKKTCRGVPTPRQALILVLKSYYFVSDDYAAKVAPFLECKKEDLDKMLNELRALRQKKDVHIKKLREQCYSQYYRCLSFENRLVAMEKGSAGYDRLHDIFKRNWLRLFRMRYRLKRMRIEATNMQVAKVMGVAKGTVDASMSLVKRKLSLFKLGNKEKPS